MTEAFGRSPAMDLLGDLKEMNLHLERITHYGVIPRGITVYRHAPRDWRILPEPMK